LFLSASTTSDSKPLTDYNDAALVHGLMSSRLDYCNSILYGISEVHLRPLHSVDKLEVRFITDKKKVWSCHQHHT